jgi:glutamate-1-semialdehyde aminotransferase
MSAGMNARIQAFQRHLLDEGVLSMRGGFIGSTPMTDDDIDFTIEAVRRALKRLPG